MTSATSRSNLAGPRGFSLVELLVVIGIILVIAGISLPMLIKAYTSADKSKAAADLQTISLALEAYKTDFGDYPRTNGVRGLGAVILCKALVAPGPATGTAAEPWASGIAYSAGEIVLDGGMTYVCIQNIRTSNPDAYAPTSNTNYWTAFLNADADGADGLGFRVRVGMGKPKPAYLQVDRLKVRGLMLTNKDGHPILYYPANPAKPNVNTAPNYVAQSPAALYNAEDNLGLMTLNNLRASLGDYNLTGAVDSAHGTEQAVTGYNYLLFAAGPDGTFGPTLAFTSGFTAARWSANKTAVQTCDDVTNFTRP
jgi:prepilin-type N-terminal cleavage/methylation domain-containing protein